MRGDPLLLESCNFFLFKPYFFGGLINNTFSSIKKYNDFNKQKENVRINNLETTTLKEFKEKLIILKTFVNLLLVYNRIFSLNYINPLTHLIEFFHLY